MTRTEMSRCDWMIASGAILAAATLPVNSALGFAQSSAPAQAATAPSAGDADRQRRMKWWHEARFGMFIHWGLYSVIGRHEWVMENEGIPVSEYAPLAKQFKPKPYPARESAKLARETGMRYLVMTNKHHEGSCHVDTKTPDPCPAK